MKNESITLGPASFVETDLSAFYGGIAGACASSDGVSLCNSCIDSASLQGCNVSSVYSTLAFNLAFKVTKDVTGKAELYFQNSAGTDVGAPISIASTAYTTNSPITFSGATWARLCDAAGLPSCTSGTGGIFSGKIAFGVDADADSQVEADERRTIPFTIHFMSATDLEISRTYCPDVTTATGTGFCQATFKEGDEKVFVDDFTLGTNTVTDTIGSTTITIDALAIFPIPTTVGGEAATIGGFRNSQATPIFKTIDSTLGISDSRVEGGLQNYQKYCFIYGTRNKAQNIYRFVVDPAIATEACVTPSENVGILEDKSCFISTAAFGSDMAPEVNTFREFRNRYLLTSTLGKSFVRFYYKISPPISDIIAGSDTLRFVTRTALYPFLFFASATLEYGILESILGLLVMLILLLQMKKVMKLKYLVIVLILFSISPKAQSQMFPPKTKISNTNVDDGLTRITKDGVYVYDIERPLRNQSSKLTFGQAQQPEISIEIEQVDATGNATGAFQTFIFEDFYGDASNFIVSYEYEWFPWVGKGGKLGAQGGGSLMYAQGNGIQLASFSPSVEKYSFFTIPLTLGAVYRFEYKDKQWIAPYVSGGGTYTVLLEKREDRSQIKGVAAPGFYAAGGALLNLAIIDEDSSYTLDSEYGVSNLWITLEYRIIEVQSEAFGYSSSYINAGLAFDF